MTNLKLTDFLMASLWSLPFALVHLTGLVLAVSRWKRHPRVSLLSTLAFGIFLFNILLGRGIFYWRWNMTEVGNFAATMKVVHLANHASNGLSLAAWILLMVALFGWRDQASAGSSVSATQDSSRA